MARRLGARESRRGVSAPRTPRSSSLRSAVRPLRCDQLALVNRLHWLKTSRSRPRSRKEWPSRCRSPRSKTDPVESPYQAAQARLGRRPWVMFVYVCCVVRQVQVGNGIQTQARRTVSRCRCARSAFIANRLGSSRRVKPRRLQECASAASRPLRSNQRSLPEARQSRRPARTRLAMLTSQIPRVPSKSSSRS